MSFFNNVFKSLFGKKITKTNIEPIFKLYNDKIYPWVKVTFNDQTQIKPNQIEFVGDEALVSRSWLGDLEIFYVADNGNYFQLFLERDLPSNVSKEQLHSLAISNLERDIDFKVQETKFGGYGLVAGGNHEAAAICLPNIWNFLAERFNDNLIVAIPSKDLVMMVPESDKDKIAKLKIAVLEVCNKHDRLLTKNIFKFDRKSSKWTIFDNVK